VSRLAVGLLLAVPAAARADADLAETARQLNNPVASVWNIVLQNNYTLLDGDVADSPKGRWLTNVQPVLPVPLTEEWNLISRPIVPLLSAPVPRPDGGFDREGGLGDIAFQAFVSPRSSGGLTWGLGPVLVFPTASDDALGAEKWSAGPGAVLLSVSERWVVGGLLSHVQSYAGAGDRSDVSLTSFQYFATRILPGQWQVGLGSPTITANWEADSDDRWTLPIGLGVGKTFRIGKMPFQMAFEASYAVIHPDTFGERWNFRLILKPVVPALVRKPIFGR
jgi:hypothetical protein